MLDFIRKNRRSFLGTILVVIAVAFMLPFGIGAFRGLRDQSSGAAIKVNKKEISFLDYEREVEQLRESFRQQLGQSYGKLAPMLNLEQRAIDQLVNSTLLDQFAKKTGLTAGPGQVKQQIETSPYFQGGMTRDAYEQFLRLKRMSAREFEELARQGIVATQIERLFADVSQPTEAELRKMFVDQNRKASFRYLSFAPAQFEVKVKIDSEDELKRFYDEHAEQFRRPRAVQFAFVAFQPQDYASQVDVTDEDIRDLYETQKDKLAEPAQVHLRKMFFNKKSQPNELQKLLGQGSDGQKLNPRDLAKGRAEEASGQVNANVPFEEVAAKLSEDPTSARSGGDMGWLRYDEISDKKLRAAAAKLAQGEVSELIETDDGFYLLYAEEVKEKQEKPYEEVRAQLEQQFRLNNAAQYAQAAAESFLAQVSAIEGDNSLKEAAQKENLKVVATEKALSRHDGMPGLPQPLVESASAMSEGDEDVFQHGDTTYVVQSLKVEESEIPEFAKVKDKVEALYRKEKAVDLAKAAAEQTLHKLKGQDGQAITLDQAAASSSTTIETTELATKQTAKGPLFISMKSSRQLFALSAEKRVADEAIKTDDGFAVVELASIEEPKDEDFAKQKDELQSAAVQQNGARMMEDLLKTLRKNAAIWVNPRLLSKDKPVEPPPFPEDDWY